MRRELEGTPDLVVEIISDSSVRKDRKLLREAYARAGIPEYWLIDARGAEVDFQILVHAEDDYAPAKRTGGWQVSPTFGKKFRLRRIIDEFFYDLLIKPRLVAGKHVPGIGLNNVYEQNSVPQLPQVLAAVRNSVIHLLAGVEADSRAAAIRRLNNHPEEALALVDLPQLV